MKSERTWLDSKLCRQRHYLQTGISYPVRSEAWSSIATLGYEPLRVAPVAEDFRIFFDNLILKRF